MAFGNVAAWGAESSAEASLRLSADAFLYRYFPHMLHLLDYDSLRGAWNLRVKWSLNCRLVRGR